MIKKRESLGRGLSAILEGSDNKKMTTESKHSQILIGQINEIEVSKIERNPFQPRIDFNQEQLYELAASIEELGIIQPITVRKLDEKKYQLISGERRLRASKIAKLQKIPAFIRVANDQEMLEMALVENIQREDLNAIEIALSYQRLITEIKLTQEECSERVGKNRSTVANFLRLLKLPSEIQKGLAKAYISVGHARALISIKNPKSQLNIYNDIVENGYSVREVEQLSKEFANKYYKNTSKKKDNKKIINNLKSLPFHQQKLIHDISKKLDSEIQLTKGKDGKGKIIIHFNSESDLFKTLEIINK